MKHQINVLVDNYKNPTMIFRVTFDDQDKPVDAKAWLELSISSFEIAEHPENYKFKGYSFVDAETKEEAIRKA